MDLSNLFEVIKNIGQKDFRVILRGWAQTNIGSGASSFDYMYSKGFVFNQYESLKKSFEFLESIRNKNPKENYELGALNFVNDRNYSDYKTFTDFINTPSRRNEKIKEISSTIIENIKTIINLGGLYENDKIIITEDTRGIFDFGLASMGLYRPVEFYSENLNEDIKNKILPNPFGYLEFEDGVVNPDDVVKKIIGNKNVFIYTFNGKDYICERRQKGATKVFNTFSDECFLKSNNDGLILTYHKDNIDKVFNGKDRIRLKYASNNKKCYLIYNKKDDSVKNVDIFMPINFITGVNESTKALLLLPAYLICASLEEFGIQSRLSALRIGSDKNTNISVSIPIKDYDESTKEAFDRAFRLMASNNSAESFFAFFKVIAENEGIQAKATGRIQARFDDVMYFSRFYMNDMMQRYKNWSLENKDEPFVNSRVTNPNFQFALPTIDSNIAESDLKYEDVLKRLHDIFFTFYYYMDFLAIEMLEMNKFVAQIYKRFTEDETFRKLYIIPSDKKEIKDLIQNYVVGILVEKYKKVEGGKYSDTAEQIKAKNDSFVEKVNKLTESINML